MLLLTQFTVLCLQLADLVTTLPAQRKVIDELLVFLLGNLYHAWPSAWLRVHLPVVVVVVARRQWGLHWNALRRGRSSKGSYNFAHGPGTAFHVLKGVVVVLLPLLVAWHSQMLHILSSGGNIFPPILPFLKAGGVPKPPLLTLCWQEVGCLRVVLRWYILKGLKAIGIDAFRGSLREHLPVLVHFRGIRLNVVLLLPASILSPAGTHPPFSLSCSRSVSYTHLTLPTILLV